VLLNTAPYNWTDTADKKQQSLGLEGLEAAKQRYLTEPSNESFRKLLEISVPYMCSKPFHNIIQKTFHTLPISYQAFNWGMKYKQHYDAQWIPQIPTMIIGSDNDYMTPFSLFREDSRFQQSNIQLLDLPAASHLSWLEEEEAILAAFNAFAERV